MVTFQNTFTLNKLPPSPSDKKGWPWTEQSQVLSSLKSNEFNLPKISVVIPNYNQGHYLEETIRSVLLQNYPNLECIIIDGGSTDSSVEIIKKYKQFLTYWISERDRGQSHGINKGFAKATGDYIAWMNSSDCYMPNALISIFANSNNHNIDLIFGLAAYCGKSLNEIQTSHSKNIRAFKLKYILRFFYSIDYIIPSQSVFISQRLLNKVGLLNEDLHYCMDLEWYARMAVVKPSVSIIQKPYCFYRFHDDAKTANYGNSVKDEAIDIALEYSSYLSNYEQKKLYRLISYNNILTAYRTGNRKQSIINLLHTLLCFPVQSLNDSRFLGLLKRNLMQYYRLN